MEGKGCARTLSAGSAIGFKFLFAGNILFYNNRIENTRIRFVSRIDSAWRIDFSHHFVKDSTVSLPSTLNTCSKLLGNFRKNDCTF